MAYRDWAKWELFCVDSFDKFEGQFPSENPVQNIGAQYENGWTLNRNDPITQWIHGTLETWSFDVTLRALHAVDDLRSKIKWLQDSVKKDDVLKRPPIYVWTWGTIQVTCLIQSLGGIRYELQPKGPLGAAIPRQVSFSITLQKYVEYDLKVTDPNAPFSDTFFWPAKLGQTYEAIAEQHYGEASWGDLIRRRHPELPYPLAGKIITLPEPENLLEEDLEPESAPLGRTEEGLEARQALFELRATEKVSHVI